jgi:hypothetical protein
MKGTIPSVGLVPMWWDYPSVGLYPNHGLVAPNVGLSQWDTIVPKWDYLCPVGPHAPIRGNILRQFALFRCKKVAGRCSSLRDVARRCRNLKKVAARCATLQKLEESCSSLRDVAKT